MSFAPYIAAHRFGLGAGVREMNVISRDPKGWALNQIKPGVSTILKGSFETTGELAKIAARGRDASPEERREMARESGGLFRDEMEARFNQAVSSQTPLVERLVMFWSNHFTISVPARRELNNVAGAYEREAIRPHIFGKFSDMLLAVVQHPAMLVYLNNNSSVGPNSRAGQRRDRGLNENLAREIMELHTLGVNGGYTQNDVIALAKIITGWSIVPPRQGGGGFQFFEFLHEPGTQVLLGKRYSQSGQAQGIAALKDLAAHPSTARFIATKMARHFVSDNPPNSAISKLEKTFLRTGGDLRAMTQAVIELPEVWAENMPKYKTPYELVVSAFRLMKPPQDSYKFMRVVSSLRMLDHYPFYAPSPAGWPDKEADWMSPNAVLNRVEWCHAFAQFVRPEDSPLKTAQIVLGGAANPDTLLWIERAPSPVDGLGLLLASPEWQRR